MMTWRLIMVVAVLVAGHQAIEASGQITIH